MEVGERYVLDLTVVFYLIIVGTSLRKYNIISVCGEMGNFFRRFPFLISSRMEKAGPPSYEVMNI